MQAGWLGSSSRGVDPLASPAPKWQLLAPPLNTQCLVAKLCLSLTDEWGKERERREEGTQNAAIRSLFFLRVEKKKEERERPNLKEVLAPRTHTHIPIHKGNVVAATGKEHECGKV